MIIKYYDKIVLKDDQIEFWLDFALISEFGLFLCLFEGEEDETTEEINP